MTTEPDRAPLGDEQNFTTGVLGTLVLVVGSFGCAAVAATGYESPLFRYRYAVIMVVAFLVMAAHELLVVKVHRRNFDFGRPHEWTDAARRRVLVRSGALGANLLLAVAAYTVLTHYGLNLGGARLFRFEGSWYAPYFRLFFPLCAVVAVLGPAYAWLSERYGRWSADEDDLLNAGRGYATLAYLRRPDGAFWAAQRALLVKFFFLPLMTVFLVGNAGNLELAVRQVLLFGGGPAGDTHFLALVWTVGFHATYVVDVALAILGYVVAMRLFDTHVRSADPTVSGWIVAVMCYPPFNQMSDLYLGYQSAEHSWSGSLGGHPVVLVALGGATLVIAAIYALATVAFGLRFSNMTNRGIVARGPYAWVRHPAYVTKTLGWWLISAPFLTGVGNTVRLCLWTMIYVARALTEERHLMADPNYRAYMEKVRWRFIPGVW